MDRGKSREFWNRVFEASRSFANFSYDDALSLVVFRDNGATGLGKQLELALKDVKFPDGPIFTREDVVKHMPKGDPGTRFIRMNIPNLCMVLRATYAPDAHEAAKEAAEKRAHEFSAKIKVRCAEVEALLNAPVDEIPVDEKPANDELSPAVRRNAKAYTMLSAIKAEFEADAVLRYSDIDDDTVMGIGEPILALYRRMVDDAVASSSVRAAIMNDTE